jgi:sugar lactone lactonase YvrE
VLNRLQYLGRGQRLLIFALFFVGGLMAIVALTVFLILLSLNTSERGVAAGTQEGVTVAEFAVLPDDDSYPSSVTVSPDGTVYTGSYATGVLWAVSASGEVSEISGSRDQIGSITALAAGPDGTVYILDRLVPNPRSSGGLLWSYQPGRGLTELGNIPDEQGFIAPIALAVDGAGRIYAADLGRREIWRFSADVSEAELWWEPPVSTAAQQATAEPFLPTALAYDPANDAILITGPVVNTLYRVPVTRESTQIVYQYEGAEAPGFDGVAVTPDGTIYLAALDQNALAVLRDNQIVYIASGFRGASDVAAGPDGRLYVTNFDSRALVTPGISPQLPFAIDVVTVE